MTTAEDVKKLAALARIKVNEDEIAGFTKEFDAILAYVGQLDGLDLQTDGSAVGQSLHNVMREDNKQYASGTYTEKLAAQFPKREGDALVVKQILNKE